MRTPVRITVEGEPTPKARPRIVNGHVYTPSSDVENALAVILRRSGHSGHFAGCRSLSVAFSFYGASKRADIDNLVKLALDALVKAEIVPDDRYVTALYAERHDSKRPRTIFYVAER